MNSWLARLLDEAEARQLPALIDDWERADDARRWIARALRIDLALAIERPEIVMPALQRRLVRFGDDGPWFERTQQPRHAHEAAALVADWIAAWSPGRRWLRSLWPAPIALDAGVVAEYRSDLHGEVVFSEDGRHIAVIERETQSVWERATGRQSKEVTLAVPARPTDWELVEQSGRIVLASRGRTIDIAIDEDEQTTGLDILSPRFAVAGGMNGDGYSWWVVDLERARLVTSGDGVPMASAATSERCFVAVRNVIFVFDADRLLGSWSCPDARALAISPEGLVATRTDRVIRIWDPARAITAGVKRTHLPVPATTLWAPDGKQLVSSGMLFDRDTGDLIAKLQVADWSGAIEGSPAANYQCFTERGFAETSHHGLSVWDREGRILAHDQARRAWGSREVSIDPTGQRYAVYRGDQLDVTTLIGNERVYLSQIAIAGDRYERKFGFAPDGALWWETTSGERFRLAPSATVPSPTDAEQPGRPPSPINPRDGLLVMGDVALPLDEPVHPAPGAPWYAGRSTLIQLVG